MLAGLRHIRDEPLRRFGAPHPQWQQAGGVLGAAIVKRHDLPLEDECVAEPSPQAQVVAEDESDLALFGGGDTDGEIAGSTVECGVDVEAAVVGADR